MSDILTADEFMVETPETTRTPVASAGKVISADDFEREYQTLSVPPMSENVNAGVRFMVGLTDYTESLERMPSQLMVYMGNAIRAGSFRAKQERNRPAGLYSQKDDIAYTVGNRLLNLGLKNLRLIQARQAETAVPRDEKMDFARDLGQGAPSIIQSVLLGATAGVGAGAIAIGAQMLGQKTEQMIDDPEKSLKKAPLFGIAGEGKLVSAPLMAALVEGGLESATLGGFLKATGPFIKRTIKQTIIEGGQEFAQTAGEAAGDMLFGMRDVKEVPDALVESVYSFALGAVLGGGTAVGFNVANRNATIDHLTEITGDRKRATKIADKMLEGALDDVTSILETESAMKQSHGEILNAVYDAAYKAVESSGAMANLSEDDKAAAVKMAAKSFADQVVTEALYRNVPATEILDGTDISVNAEGNIVIVGKGSGEQVLNQPEMTPAERFLAERPEGKVEEYLASKPIVFRGVGGVGKGSTDWGQGIYYTKDIKTANVYKGDKGSLIQAQGLSNPLIVDYSNWEALQKSKASIEKKAKELGVYSGVLKDDVTAVAKALGHDGIEVNGQGIEVHFLEPKTKSQLTAEFNAAKAKMKPASSAEQFLKERPEGTEIKAYRYGKDSGDVLFSSKNKDYSEEYALVKGGKPEDVREITFSAKNPLVVELGQKEFSDPVVEKKYIEKAIKQGNDVVIFKDKAGGDEFYAQISEFNAAKAKVLNQGGDKPRASITIGRNAYIIELTKNSDPTALPHEFAHYWLDNMNQFVKSGKASKAYMARWQNLSSFLGISKGQDFITDEQQEKFARGYEAYLYKGVAPSPQLADEFAQYRKWMRSVYSDIKQLDVELSPQAEAFFDSMMVVDNAYIENRQKFGTRKRPNRLGRDTSEFIDKLFVPLSTRLSKVDDKLKVVLRRHIFDVNMANKKDIEAVRPFIEKMSKLNTDDYKDLDLALKNVDMQMVDEIVKRNGMEVEFTRMQQVIEDIYDRAKNAGMDVGYIENYFPRRIQDTEEYLEFLRGGRKWTVIGKSIREEERKQGRPLTEEEKAHVADMTIRGYGEEKIDAGRPSNVKARKIQNLTADQNTFYKPSPTALLEYISSMNDKIEASKFLGNGKNFDESIGAYVNKLIDDGIISAKQEKEVRAIFKSYFGKRGTSGLISGYKNFSYIYTMGSPISAVTQLGDFAFSLYKNGYYGTLKSVVSKGKLTKQDIGIDNIIEEFSDSSKAGKAVSAVFKAVGLEGMDAMGKSVIIDGAFTRLSNLAKKGQLDLEPIFGDGAKQVVKDLIAKNPTDDVKFLLFCELADVQPIALSELPEGYVSGGNARLFYMLKSYTIKQLDLYHNEVFRQFPTNPVKAIGNLLRLSFALMLMGMSADAIKDLLLGRPFKIDDIVVDNILKLVGFSKYTIYKAKREGALTAAMQMMNPPIPFMDDMIKDLTRLFDDKDDEAKDLRIWNALPIVGKFYFWWFGGGRRYIEEKQ